uniref:Helitron helicase-like domain-containing protein n=1 Tax=Lactuca sativa TaxID=4236 RepID=A0A9R1VJP0_LACSA|nr:hypothetical protein LSAT_V11C500239490 [Lactuca sativa]
MQRRFLDAMTLVQENGRPDIFLTMTCNPNWKEIVDDLLPGQTAQDRPDLVARVFHAKLEDPKVQLLKRNFICEVGAHVYVVEFQKRGLPHAYFLLIMRPGHKMTNPDDYDKIVCAEIPDPIKYPAMQDLVKNHMIHGPCGSLREKSPCMEGVPKKCRFRYPRQFKDKTSQREDSYPLNRRRNNGVEVNIRNLKLDNRWVAPYNPKLLMMFNCHINVEVCSSIKYVKYIFKYVYKGHDKQVIHIDQDKENEMINEIRRPTCFEDIYTTNGVLHPTFRKSALERGLIVTDDNLSQCLAEASLFQYPNALRRLFAMILIFCEPGDVRKLWCDHYDSLSEDYRKQYACSKRVQNMVLIDIRVFLQSLGKKLSDYGLPDVNEDINLQARGLMGFGHKTSYVLIQTLMLGSRFLYYTCKLSKAINPNSSIWKSILTYN